MIWSTTQQRAKAELLEEIQDAAKELLKALEASDCKHHVKNEYNNLHYLIYFYEE